MGTLEIVFAFEGCHLSAMLLMSTINCELGMRTLLQ